MSKRLRKRLLSRSPAKRSTTAVGELVEPGRDAPFLIVGIGASAGGLEAFTQLLGALPTDTGMGFVLVQHLDPDHESALTQILTRATSLPVREITHDERVRADHVYIIPRDKNLGIVEGVLQLQQRQRTRSPHRPIDSFFEALAQDQLERAVGVVLSGTATDGTLGLEAIKAEGGITFAQDDSAKYDSMPRSAIAAGCVDRVLSPVDIAKELARLAKHPVVARQASFTDSKAATTDEGERVPRTARAAKTAETAEGAVGDSKKILFLLLNHTGVDFSFYKPATIQRRIGRRLMLTKQNSLGEYANFLRGNVKELDALFSDLLISVTSFFRGPDTFELLRDQVLPELLEQRGDDPLRCWVLGCSTGQEAYSIAMTFTEVADKALRMRKVQIFATDVNDTVLDKARLGLYPKSIADDVTPERLRRFFVEEDGGYRVNKALREMVVFASHNLIADPPFSRMDLISCRNLLIYLEPSLQQRLLPMLHYALKPHGVLFLGASESIGGFTDLFEPVDKKNKVYTKKAAPNVAFALPVRSERHRQFPAARLPHPSQQPDGLELPESRLGEADAQREADRVSVHRFAPPGVIVNAELQVLQFRGSTGAFLEPPTGKPTFDVLKLAREGLMLPLRSAINQAKKEDKASRRDNVSVRRNGKTRTVNLEVMPLKNLRERCFLILFEEPERGNRERDSSQVPPPRAERARDRESPSRITALEAEVSETRDYLRSTEERHEAANEELQAANEEVQSANEELQSLNEELETSKEELESANEELSTVNEEMSHRNAELNRLNDDLINFQTATKVGVVLLGRDLRVRRFSPQAEEQFGLRLTDVGQSVGLIRHNLVLGDARSPLDLAALSSGVVSDLREQEREVCDHTGRWYSLRVRPYISVDGKVDGAVLVLVDIDALKRNELTSKRLESELRARGAEMTDANVHKDEFLAMLGHELRNPLAALTHGLELLGRVPDDRPRSEQLRGMMLRQTDRIGTLLDQLLDLARLMSGKVVLSRDRVDLAEVVRAAVETVRGVIGSEKHEVALSVSEKSAFVMGDSIRLTQIVENLLTNAVKYTNPGGHVAVSIESSEGQARIIVRDDGSGISAEFLPHVFEAFTQAPRTLDRAKGGLGLGLPLVHHLVEMHGGRVTASSPGLGLGSEFTVTLPLMPEERAPARPGPVPASTTESASARSRRILVVDDERDTASALQETLRLDGHECLAVHDGLAALADARTFQPDVVLLDLGLPGIDGYEVARRLREEHGDEKMLVLAVTGYQRDFARLQRAGFDQHMIKPLNLKRLSRLLAGWDSGMRPSLSVNEQEQVSSRTPT